MPINAAHGNIREPSGEGWDRLESRLTGRNTVRRRRK